MRKDLKKHCILIHAALVLFVLAGCSSIKSAEKPSSSFRTNSVWSSSMTAKELVPQNIEGVVLQAGNMHDTGSAQRSQSSKPVMNKSEGRKVASQKRSADTVGGSLDKVLSVHSETKYSTVMGALEGVITIPETAEEDEEQPTN